MKREYILDMEYEWSVGNAPRANGEEENQMVHKFIVSCIFCRRRYGIPQFPRWSSSSIIGPFSSVFLWSLMEPIKKWNTHGNLLVGLPGDGPPSCTLGPSPTRGTRMPFSAFSQALSAEFNNNCPCCEPGCYQATTCKCMEGLVMLNADSF